MKITKFLSKKEAEELGTDCKNCGNCCQYGSGILTDEDTKNISKHLNIQLDKFIKGYLDPITKFGTTLHKPKLKQKGKMPFGKCIFYEDDKKCAIHSVKPLNCKVATCSDLGTDLNLWFQLTYFVNPEDPQSVRDYAEYLKTGGKTLEGFELKNLIKDKKKLKEILKVGGLDG